MTWKERIMIGSGLMMVVWIGLGLPLIYGVDPDFNDLGKMYWYLGIELVFTLVHVVSRKELW